MARGCRPAAPGRRQPGRRPRPLRSADRRRSGAIAKGWLRLPEAGCLAMLLEAVTRNALGYKEHHLAKDTGVPTHWVGDIVAGRRAVTATSDLRLCRCFDFSGGWCLRGQGTYDTSFARETMHDELARTPRCSMLAAQKLALVRFAPLSSQRSCARAAGVTTSAALQGGKRHDLTPPDLVQNAKRAHRALFQDRGSCPRSSDR
jgi:antitoxin HigA-1